MMPLPIDPIIFLQRIFLWLSRECQLELVSGALRNSRISSDLLEDSIRLFIYIILCFKRLQRLYFAGRGFAHAQKLDCTWSLQASPKGSRLAYFAGEFWKCIY